MTCEIQNRRPSRESVVDAVPLRHPLTVKKSASASTWTIAAPEPACRRSVEIPPCSEVRAATSRAAGMKSPESMPLSRKTGVRFMIRSSRRKIARTGR